MIKPKIFIGSSKERLDIAYALQENLEFDSEPTVWTQGIFKLSKNTLESLVDSLETFDYAIFVFHPDDMSEIRGKEYNVIRDNLIFELGLFIGKIGRDKVFFLIPQNFKNLHIPTDLIGITPGTYNAHRKDKNLKASLGPFCNQVREELKDFVYLNIEGFKEEPQIVKDIILNKSDTWEFELADKLLDYKLKEVYEAYDSIKSGFVIQRMKNIDGDDFNDWYANSLTNFQNYIELFTTGLTNLEKSFGPEGESGKPIDIKNAVDKLLFLCQELISWEYELASLNPPEGLIIVKEKLNCATKPIVIDPLEGFHQSLKSFIEKLRDPSKRNNGENKITVTPKIKDSLKTISQDFQQYFYGN
ncbi:MAG TPA: hypothetical protein DEA82_04450 [Flavobacteriaceae bacterium]|nr:hypothetical protein [Flavobacteriaceae bacterium]